MSPQDIGGPTALERLLRRYQRTETRCPARGYDDREGNWRSETDGSTVVYHHTCRSCGAERDHSFHLRR